VDGCPAGLELCEADIQSDLDKRRPGASKFSTPRAESDSVAILSGVFGGVTTGSPIALAIANSSARPEDYDDIKDLYRPGHADYTTDMKFGLRDYRGGGRSSARETAARVAAGAVARKVIAEAGISVAAYAISIGGVSVSRDDFDLAERDRNALRMPGKRAFEQAADIIDRLAAEGDSAGGVVECVIKGVPAGLGEPVFDKLNARLSAAISSIGAVKGVEFGAGFGAAGLTGSVNNDQLRYENGELRKLTDNSGGMSGGISEGFDITLRAAFKPTPSIRKVQKTASSFGENAEISAPGRHDPLVVPRAVAVVEAMAAMTVCDMLLINMVSRIDSIKKIYEKTH
jgi:chorismate synthase